ncbi:MAG: type II toxin-antitoxin system VapC family toxin [Propionibacteriaceae bacterium]|nr:type II toxin-antitoxin system VapC family toxin [Propionibacteriaceae bacterium]
MIVDSSALMAVVLGEPEAPRILALLKERPGRISAASVVEVGIVADLRAPGLASEVDTLVADLELTVEPLTARQAGVARQAHRRYGWRSGSPARLNFGDCLAYALAVDLGEELLFKGDDFTHTDVLQAAW